MITQIGKGEKAGITGILMDNQTYLELTQRIEKLTTRLKKSEGEYAFGCMIVKHFHEVLKDQPEVLQVVVNRVHEERAEVWSG